MFPVQLSCQASPVSRTAALAAKVRGRIEQLHRMRRFAGTEPYKENIDSRCLLNIADTPYNVTEDAERALACFG